MKLPLFQIDAFSQRPFAGNPAAVVPLPHWPDDQLLQAIASENNLSETAFMVASDGERYALRWFTPTTEVDLCGHATLAAAWVHFHCLDGKGNSVTFDTAGGTLPVSRDAGRLVLDFPARPGKPAAPNQALFEALGIEPEQASEILQARDTLVVIESAELLASLTPDMNRLSTLDTFGVIVTAPGPDCDFESRFFAPAQGVPEDPVTGSAHCTLVPWWAARLGKRNLHARQVSKRGGELWCTLMDDRVLIAGHCTCVLEGTLLIGEAI